MWAVGWESPDPTVDGSIRCQDNTAAGEAYFNIFFETRARAELWVLADLRVFSLFFRKRAHLQINFG